MAKQMLLDNGDVVWMPPEQGLDLRVLKYGEGAVLFEGRRDDSRRVYYYVMREDLLVHKGSNLGRANENYRAAFFKRESTNNAAPFST